MLQSLQIKQHCILLSKKFTEEELALIEKETPKIKEGINGPRNSYKAELLERANPKAPEKSM